MNTQTFDKIPELALDWYQSGRAVAIATVTSTWGSAPRPIGSQMVVTEDGAIEGSVSGGCVEAAVVMSAQDAIADGKARMLTFGVSGDDAFAAGLACGGEISVLVEPIGTQGAGQGMEVATLEKLVAARAARRSVSYSVETENWTRTLLDAGPNAQTQHRGQCFTHLHEPPQRLVIAGAVHVAQALVPMAQIVGFEVILIDPRGAFATAERFPGVTQYCDYPDEVLPAIGMDQCTAIVTLAHDPKIDDPALEAALRSDAFYIGSLGSKRTQAQRLERLRARGFSAGELARIHGPVGLDIGAIGPAEIAVSIIAELVAARRRSHG